MKHIIIYSFLLLLANSLSGQESVLIPADKADNVIQIKNDTIFLVRGTTYAHTVDTPLDEGLVRTGLTVESLAEQIRTADGSPLVYSVNDRHRNKKTQGYLVTGDVVETEINKTKKNFAIHCQEGALSSTLTIHNEKKAKGIPNDIILDFIAGQRTPQATVRFYIPSGVNVTLDNTTVNVIGRGEVLLKDLDSQSIGRTGTNYSYNKVGKVYITQNGEKGQTVTFTGIDLRPFNGIDIQLKIKQVTLDEEGIYTFRSSYSTAEPEIYNSFITKQSTAVVQSVSTLSDLNWEMPTMFTYKETSALFLKPILRWSTPIKANKITIMASMDKGQNWEKVKELKQDRNSFVPDTLKPDTYYLFKLIIEGGIHAGESNVIAFYSGKSDVKQWGAKGDGKTDDTEAINRAIMEVHNRGGGIITFTNGDFPVRTVQLKTNVWLHVNKDAVIRNLSGHDAPETTWFSDRAYRSGLSPTDPAPYNDPENYMTKQDVGHTYFHNTMFFAERERNIKIFGNGRITGNGNLVTGDRVMNNTPEKRADKMFTFKLCTQIEIGGYETGKDMWYDPEKDEPYYIIKGNDKDYKLENVLHIDQGGHFVLLATGTDTLNVHDTYFGKYKLGSARDIYDFMGCNQVAATNIYSKMSSDDIVKLGSDCSLGFTRPVKDYKVRNIIGDTNCNLFQIGSETADDIQDVYVDNMYVLGSNKAGFSISANDGAYIKNIYLNTGKTGKIHSRSMMYRTRSPFFISISNRGRVIGADVKRFRFKENGVVRDELLCVNSDIGRVENIIINDIDIHEVYGGSSHNGTRWKAYDGTQNESAPIIAGYKLPDPENVEGGLNFRLPNGEHTGYITNIQFNRVNLMVKGGHPAQDADANPPEIGVGRYNVGDLKIQPAYGFWFRHVRNAVLDKCSVQTEKTDGRYAVVFDDVTGAKVNNLSVPPVNDLSNPIKEINSKDIIIGKIKQVSDK